MAKFKRKQHQRLKTKMALLRAADLLLKREGPDRMTIHAVCAAANVEAPTLYHYFGDKNGLLDAVVAKGRDEFLMREQAVQDTEDALGDLISGWKSFIEFALERPQLFRLMVQRVGDNPKIVDAAMAKTNARLTRLSGEGRLSVDVQFARRSLLALSNGAMALCTQGASKTEVRAVGHFLLDVILRALVRAEHYSDPKRPIIARLR
jgi:AcrR family transcriptional regulator